MPTLRKSYGRILTTKTKDLGHGVVSCIVSTNTKDRHGEILDIKSLNTKQYSGVVFLNHDYQQLPIGKSLGLKKTADGKLMSKTQFAIDEFDLANTVYKLVAGGYMPDVSIGFIPKEFDPESDTWSNAEMIEYSHVGIGANPEAKVQKGLESLGMDADEFKAQIKEHLKVVKALEPDSADPPEEPELPAPDIKQVKQSETKGAVANVLLEGDKYEYMEDFWEVIYAFCDAYYSQDAAVSDFNTLLQECVDILQTIVNGNYAFEDEDDEGDVMPIGMRLGKGIDPLFKAELVGSLGKKLDSMASTSDNELKQIATLKRLIAIAEQQLNQLPEDSQTRPKELRKKRVMVLNHTKQTINSIDKVAELAALEIKQRIQKEQNNV